MKKNRRSILPLILGALLLAGCDSPFTASELAGTYVLERVNTSPLPAARVDNDYMTITVFADTLRLNGDETGTDTRVQSFDLHGVTESVTAERTVAPVHYQVRGGALLLAYPCPPDAVCLAITAPQVTGAVTPDGLVLYEDGKDLVFRRVD